MKTKNAVEKTRNIVVRIHVIIVKWVEFWLERPSPVAPLETCRGSAACLVPEILVHAARCVVFSRCISHLDAFNFTLPQPGTDSRSLVLGH